jgi:hypothetical protein
LTDLVAGIIVVVMASPYKKIGSAEFATLQLVWVEVLLCFICLFSSLRRTYGYKFNCITSFSGISESGSSPDLII